MQNQGLGSILVAAEQLAINGRSQDEGLTRVNRTLKQVVDATDELWSRVTSNGVQHNEANLLLSSKGVDLTHISKKLDVINTRKSAQPLKPAALSDEETYIKNMKQNAVLSIVESSRRHTTKLIEEYSQKAMHERFINHRNNLLKSFSGLQESPIYSNIISRAPVSEVLLKKSVPLNQRELAYAECLKLYNRNVLQSMERENLVELFQRCSHSFSDQKVKEIWEIVGSVSGIPAIGVDDILQSRSSDIVVETLVRNARRYLENGYKKYMEKVVNENLLEACRGGEPGTFYLARSFVKARIGNYLGMEPIFVDLVPLWPVLYCCLRAGDFEAALQCISRCSEDLALLEKTLKEMITNPTKHLTSNSERSFASIYRRTIRSSPDPYKRLLYCMIGPCDISDNHSEVIKTADDYLWLKLCQVRGNEDHNNSFDNVSNTDRLTYRALQLIVSEEYGEDYFNACTKSDVFFQVLFLTGQFEMAIDVLLQSSRYYSEAVHIIIGLNELNLLAYTDTLQRPQLCVKTGDVVPMKRLNVCQAIKGYVGRFQNDDLALVLHYLFSLRNITYEKRNMFHTYVCELALETGKSDEIVGYIRQDGYRINGILDEFDGFMISTDEVVLDMAEKLLNKANQLEVMKLYDLAGDHESMLRTYCEMATFCGIGEKDEKARKILMEYGDEFIKRLDGCNINAKPSTVAKFHTVRGIVAFFKFYSIKQYQLALETVQALNLIPMSEEDINGKVMKFKDEDLCIIRFIPDLLIALMNTLYARYTQLREEMKGSVGSITKEESISYIRGVAKVLISYAARIPLHLPGDTNSRLLQIQTLIN